MMTRPLITAAQIDAHLRHAAERRDQRDTEIASLLLKIEETDKMIANVSATMKLRRFSHCYEDLFRQRETLRQYRYSLRAELDELCREVA
jgi:hypothetical protein